MNTYPSLLSLIGNTPLIKLDIPLFAQHTILAKLEYLNPGGSIKDRAALFMIQEAERTGELKPGGTIVEASSGNQGISLAMIGKLKGYRVIITVPDRVSWEKITTLRALGAEVVLCPNTDSHDDPRNYHLVAQRITRETPGAYMPNQYFNPANVRAHQTTTGPEIWQQTNGTVTHVIMAAGSCGTMSGVGRYLKEKNPAIKIFGVDAATSQFSCPENPKAYQAEGLGIDVITETFDQSVVDKVIPISDTDAFAMTRKLASHYGILGGITSGAVVHVATELLPSLPTDAVVVLMLADSGRSYLSKVFAPAVGLTGALQTTTEQSTTVNPVHREI